MKWVVALGLKGLRQNKQLRPEHQVQRLWLRRVEHMPWEGFSHVSDEVLEVPGVPALGSSVSFLSQVNDSDAGRSHHRIQVNSNQFLRWVNKSALGREHHVINLHNRYDRQIALSNVKSSSGGFTRNHHILSLSVSHEKDRKDAVITLRIGEQDAFTVSITMIDTDAKTINSVYAGVIHDIFTKALHSAWLSLQVVMNNIIDKASQLTGPDALNRIQVTQIVNYIFADVCSLPGIKRVDALLKEA
ncbi:hypothetical protein LTS15_007058 [Exophiala xenobiotica]|nr:hypothetical protein LTS15_007058 [Exophiala xenobiotica]